MTNKQILQSSLLDIIFENRNKEYGAYILRKEYSKRLLAALLSGCAILVLFVFLSSQRKKGNEIIAKAELPGIVIREVILPEKKIIEPKREQKIIRPELIKKQPPKFATIKFTSPPKFTEVVKEPMAAIEKIEGKLTSDKNYEGDHVEKDIVRPTIIDSPVEVGSENGRVQPGKMFITQERDPEFPGGQEALRNFLGRYLTTPGEIDAGEKKVVKIKFKVDKDGSVNTFEIVTSGGFEFDNEVVRVCKKMPRWVPALQNGINVPVNYVLPVTFIEAEE